MHSETEKTNIIEWLTYNKGVSLRRAPGLTMVMDTPKGSHECISTSASSFHVCLMTNIGRAIVAARNIQASSVVEVSPVLFLPLEDIDAVRSTTLNHYT